MNTRRCALAALACVLLLAGCGRQKPAPPPEELPAEHSLEQPASLPPLEELPADYSLEQAREDGCVVHVDGDIASGQEVWEEFLKASSAGKAAAVRLADLQTLGDPSHYNPDFYESVKDDYPLLFVSDLTFDGKAYTVSSLEDGVRHERTFSYLKYFEDKVVRPDALYDSCTGYALVNDDTAAWDPLMNGWLSSRSGRYVSDFYFVYADYIRKGESDGS